MRPPTAKPPSAGQRAAAHPRDWHPVAWQTQSLLLSYPDEQLLRHAALARRAAAALPEPVGRPLDRFLDHLARTPLQETAADYVATFDHRRRCCPFLTYYAHGDTRRRGTALLRLKRTYAAAGLRLTDDELPDHLAVVLEFAATGDPGAGLRTLLEHRAGLEVLRLALHDAHAVWSHVLDSVSATLPALGGDERGAVAALVAQGPPEEQVGLDPAVLDPYASPNPYAPPGTAVPRTAGGGR